jgi:hypothetical protein
MKRVANDFLKCTARRLTLVFAVPYTLDVLSSIPHLDTDSVSALFLGISIHVLR